MVIKKEKGEKSKVKKVTFKCRVCEGHKLIDEMVLVTRFFPPIVACRDCEKKMR